MLDFSPGVLALSYANQRVLERSNSGSEIPRATYINLGFNKPHALTESMLFMNGKGRSSSDVHDKQHHESMNNVQYISMYHASSSSGARVEETKKNNRASSTAHRNVIEIAMSEWKTSSSSASSSSGSGEVAKEISSNEFTFLFDSVIAAVRAHRPAVIVFTYDFSLTRAHSNHMYDLKPDVLGYFLHMLSLVSNQHVVFIAATNYEGHYA